MGKKFKSMAAFKRAVRRSAKDLMTAKDFKDFAHIQVRMRKKGFAEGKAPDGTSWKPLKRATIANKRRRGYKNPTAPLIAKGTLMRTPPVIADKTSARIKLAKSREKIALYHNKGNSNLPKRVNWGIYKEAEVLINKLFVKRFWKRFKDKYK